MKTIAAKDAKNGFGRMLDMAQREPVTIAKNGRPVAVVLSIDEYQRLEALDDAYWAARAEAAEQAGDWMSSEESEAWLRNLVDARD